MYVYICLCMYVHLPNYHGQISQTEICVSICKSIWQQFIYFRNQSYVFAFSYCNVLAMSAIITYKD